LKQYQTTNYVVNQFSLDPSADLRMLLLSIPEYVRKTQIVCHSTGGRLVILRPPALSRESAQIK